jgi:hypothetical protein
VSSTPNCRGPRLSLHHSAFLRFLVRRSHAATLATIGVEGGIFGQVMDSAAVVAAPTDHADARHCSEAYGTWRRTLCCASLARKTHPPAYWLQTSNWHAGYPGAVRSSGFVGSYPPGCAQRGGDARAFAPAEFRGHNGSQGDLPLARRFDYQPPSGFNVSAAELTARIACSNTGGAGLFRDQGGFRAQAEPCGESDDGASYTLRLSLAPWVMFVRPRSSTWMCHRAGSARDVCNDVVGIAL